MNDSQILSYIFYSLDHCGPISEARANALAAWIKRCRAEEVELQESMSACTKTAEELYRRGLELRQGRVAWQIRQIVRDEIYRLETCRAPASFNYNAPPQKWAHCKTYSYDMIDHSPEYRREYEHDGGPWGSKHDERWGWKGREWRMPR